MKPLKNLKTFAELNESENSKPVFKAFKRKDKPNPVHSTKTYFLYEVVIDGKKWFLEMIDFVVSSHPIGGGPSKTVPMLTIWSYDAKFSAGIHIYSRDGKWLVPEHVEKIIPKVIFDKVKEDSKMDISTIKGAHPDDPEYWKGRKEKRFMTESKKSTDKKVGEFVFDNKKYDILQDSNDSSGFGIQDETGSWDVIAMGDEFNPDTFDEMDLKKMNKWIDAGIKHFTAMKTVSAKDVRHNEWSDFFQNELEEQVPMNKFYVLAKLTCGKENAKSSR